VEKITIKDKKFNDMVSEWVENYSESLFSWAFYKTSNKEIAEDLVQETFIAALQSVDKFENKSNPKTWLFSILKNKIIDYHRKNFKNIISNESQLSLESDGQFFDNFFKANGNWKSKSQPAMWEETNELTTDTDFMSILQYCLDNLPELWNSAIHLKYIDNSNGKMICEELEITSSNYWQIMHRAKLQLRVCIENNWFEK
jgi:RNA polymerase sigma-70 factor (TIGR02943 family)